MIPKKIKSISINDLRREINQTRLEISSLKEKQNKVENENDLNKVIVKNGILK